MSSQLAVADFLRALNRTQYLPAPRLLAYQRALLANLINHARAQTSFYPERLAALFRRDNTIDWEGWSELPILTRSEAQANFAALCARSLPPAAGGASEDTSSGSTGRPLKHLSTDIQHVASACSSERFFNWHNIDPNGLTVRIRAASHPDAQYPKGLKTTGWRVGHPRSEAIDLSIAASIEQQLNWLKRIKPRYLATYPSNLREIAKFGPRGSGALRFDAIMTFAEMTSDDMQASFQDYFGMPALDRYGSSEVGHISGTCPHSRKHHVASELVLLELVDDDGRPTPAGSIGRVVVTPFYNLAMPLIRYELGDYGVLSPEPCGCGRTLPLLDRILGRARNVFRFSDGVSKWPVLLSRDFQTFVPNKQFQFVQRTRTDIEFRYVPADEHQHNDVRAFTAYVRDKLHPSVSVTLTKVETIARSAGGKFEDYMSLVADA